MNKSLAEIYAAIPHRPPFLLVDEIVSRDGGRIVCRKHFSGDEWFFAGHYPDEPVVPGVLLCEAALQAGAILLGGTTQTQRADDPSERTPPDCNASLAMPVVTRMNEVRFKQMVRPGDTIELEVQLREQLADAFFFDAKVTCNGKLAARLEFACMLVAKSEAPP
ncbi:MAG TPA: 3-hydroxyacyl-ACP dehydratase FabZ family protein [Pirellulales bacterium]|jgi:3-hydroxyacyl-[acyl-carrier-protein] dehydratase|nr:3-hydroxyacyl-ACP dehydratase FabZ family protein [Pirellulales bacterium]